MMFRHYTAAVALSVGLTFIAPGADAASVTNSTVTFSAGDVSVSSSETRVSGDNIRFAQVLSSKYNRPVAPSELIRLKVDFDFGFGDISLIYATAAYSGRPVDEISRYRYEHMGWGEIAKLYGVKVKDLKKSNEDVVNAARGRGIDITYIEIDDDSDYGHHGDDHRSQGDDRDHKNTNKLDDKHDNGKGHGNKR